MRLAAVVLLAAVTLVCEGEGELESEFCKICKCDGNNVECPPNTNDLENVFSRKEFWMKDDNTSYPINRVRISGNVLSRVTQLPPSNITVLDLSNDQIQFIDDSSFKDLQEMQILILSHNRLVSKELRPHIFQGIYKPEEYMPLKSLRILRLNGNLLHSLHQDLFEHTPYIDILDLHNNPFDLLDFQTTIAIGSLRDLKVLDLSDTRISQIPNHFFHPLRELKYLNLSFNQFTVVPLNIGEAMGLEWISFDGNPIVNVTRQNPFPHMQQLKVLHMCNMPQLEQIGDGGLSHLESLEELHIAQNPLFTSFGPKSLSRVGDGESEVWPQLKILNIRDNNLQYLSRSLIANWEDMKEIDIRTNPWACECENQWMTETLMEIIQKVSPDYTIDIRCGHPEEMEHKSLMSLYKTKYTLRCLDYYGNRPERDAAILVALLVILLIGIPLILGAWFCYRNNYLSTLFRNNANPAAFSRKFYNRTNSDEMF